jgi:glutamyl-tRNA synthetase
VNYIALLGWSPKDTREIFTLDELTECFNISGISKSPSAFDYEKLNYFNAEHLRNKADDEYHSIVLPYIRKAVTNTVYDTLLISKTLKQRVEILSEIPGMITFYESLPEYEAGLFENKKNKSTPETARESLKAVLEELDRTGVWNHDSIYQMMVGIAQSRNVKTGQVMWPVRVALTGTPVTPGGAVEIAEILGKEESRRRIEAGYKML